MIYVLYVIMRRMTSSILGSLKEICYEKVDCENTDVSMDLIRAKARREAAGGARLYV